MEWLGVAAFPLSADGVLDDIFSSFAEAAGGKRGSRFTGAILLAISVGVIVLVYLAAD